MVRDGDRFTVTLVIHHAIADGRHMFVVLEEFWLSYTATVEGTPFTLDGNDYPDSVEKILSDRGVGSFDYPPPPVGPLMEIRPDTSGNPPLSRSR